MGTVGNRHFKLMGTGLRSVEQDRNGHLRSERGPISNKLNHRSPTLTTTYFMMATQFQHLHLLSRTRVLLPTPPHPLQEMRPCDPSNFREIQEEWSDPVAPPPSPISSTSVHSSNTHSLGDVDTETLSITTTQEGTRWNGFL